MKITFKKVKIQNFLSFGNAETVFDYTTGINVVTGLVEGGTTRNGAGKSSLLVDSLSFALYGRPLRGDAHIKKEDLVNRVNGKNCKVEVEFSINDSNYKVVRTIKPTTLTVYEDGREIQFDRMSNTQEWLQTKLGISHTCFSNILVLNVNSSKPFLSMDARDKRQVIEDILTMNIYGRMSEMAKDLHLSAKGEKSIAENALNQCINSFEMAKNNRKSLLCETEKFEAEKTKICEAIRKEIETLEATYTTKKSEIKNDDFDSIIKSLKEKRDSIDSKLTVLNKKEAECTKTLKDCVRTLKILEHAPCCPTCQTPTDGPLIQKFIKETKECVNNSKKEVENIQNKISEGETKRKTISDKIHKAEENREHNNNLKWHCEALENDIESKNKELEKESSRTLDLDNVVSEEVVDDYEKAVKQAEEQYNKVSEDFKYNNFIRTILGEDGVRKFVLAKILPFLNSKINQYLKIMGSDYSLLFDGNLNETVITRSRDERSYCNFSSGEKKRIDLAVLLALMDVAKIQNSVDTNILILDEILDTSIDNEGVENFLDYLKTGFRKLYPEKAIYIITHRKDIGDEHFDRVINLVKKKNFTYISSIIDTKA